MQRERHRWGVRSRGAGRAAALPFVLLLLALPASAETVTYTYDAAGRLVRVSSSGGERFVYGFDLAGNLVSESSGSDTDSDGVLDAEEKGLSGTDAGYDGDGNGVPDWQEARAASFRTADGDAYVTLSVPAPVTLESVRAVPNPSPYDAPSGWRFPYGFVELTLAGLAPQGCTQATLRLPRDVSVSSAFKHANAPGQSAPSWWEFAPSGATGTQVVQDSDRTRVLLSLCDGQRGDTGAPYDGRVVDPVGPAAPATTAGLRFYPVTPCRVVDTRDPDGPWGGPALPGDGSLRDFVVEGRCDVPADAKAVAVNVTAVSPTAAGFLFVFPPGTGSVIASTLNFTPGTTRANNAVVGLGGAPGSVTVRAVLAGGTTHFILDVGGYFR